MVWVYGLLLALCALSFLAGLSVGAADLGDAELRPLLLRLRGGRIAAGFVVGAALSVGGVLVQGLFRNPLASPSITGTTAGASLGGRLALMVPVLLSSAGTGEDYALPEMALPLGCIAGAACALAMLLAVARVRDDLVVILLAGFLLSSLFMSLGALLLSLAHSRWEVSRAMVAFALGDVSGAGAGQVLLGGPLLLAGVAAAWAWSPSLDVMLSGEDEAASLGVQVRTVRRWVVVWTAVLTGAAVAIGGGIGFVGLVVPNLLRRFLGATHRRLVPTAALLGGGFVVACDVLCRLTPSQSEIPLGVVTGVIGAPVFLFLLVRSRGRMFHD